MIRKPTMIDAPPNPTLCIGTLNVCSLTGKFDRVLNLAVSRGIDILCLQETRIAGDTLQTVRSIASKKHWTAHIGSQSLDAALNPYAGTAILSRWPTEAIRLPDNPLFVGRIMAIKVHRPHCRPCILINCYLHASDSLLASRTAEAVFEWAAGTGEDWMVIGDYNLPKAHWPMSMALAGGLLWDIDGAVAEPSSVTGTTRRPNGELTNNVIDYLLASKNLNFTARTQLKGVADHDLVYYHLLIDDPVTCFRWPQHSLLKEVSVSDESWNSWWESSKEAFNSCLQLNDANGAWAILSFAAEQCLGASEHASKPRHACLKPQPKHSQFGAKHPSFQSLLERRLRRLARRAGEALVQPWNEPLQANLRRNVSQLTDQCPDLLNIDWTSASAAPSVLHIADKVAVDNAEARAEEWKTAIAFDFQRLSDWIKSDVAEDRPVPFNDSSPHPQLQVQETAEKWDAVWNPPVVPQVSAFDNLCHGLPDMRVHCPDPRIQGHMLRTLSKKAVKKSAGLDGWTGKLWECLPLPFFDALAEVWNVCLDGASLPEPWKEVRVSLLNKEDGGKRPLAIAVLAWRVCMAATMKVLKPWVRQWTLPELCGGMPGKDIHDVHAALGHDLDSSKEQGLPVAGVKADIRKCFDSVSPALAIACWEKLGAPVGLLRILTDFYSSQQRWFSIKGHFAPQPVVPSMSVLQGCPASPALLNALMVVWTKYVKLQSPSVRMALFLDDRTIWATGPDAVDKVVRAMEAATVVDTVLGFQHHPDKLECFASHQRLRDRFSLYVSLVGPVKTEFKLLGIQYFVGSYSRCADVDKLNKKLLDRCHKIRIAAKTLSLRKALVEVLVISLIKWTGPWQQYTKSTLTNWCSAIEAAIWGSAPCKGRSPYLFWCTVAGLSCHPAAALDVEALQQEWRRQYSSNAGMPVPARASSLSTTVLKKLNWEILDNGVWSTPYGQFRPGWLTLSTFRKLARLSWARSLYDNDRKIANRLPETREPYLGFHHSLVLEGGPVYKLRVAIAAASDARVLARRGIDATCSCGERCPDRTHLTFSCPDTDQPPPCRSVDEDRLLVPLVPLPNVLPLQELRPVPNLVMYLQTQFAQSGCPVVLGLDGSCLLSSKNSLWQCASWAVVGLQNAISVNGRVDGADQSPAAAERTALVQALEAAHTAQVPVRLLIDNLAIVQRLTRGIEHNSWNGDAPGFWSHVASRVAFGVQAMWVPSHGKHPDWFPSLDWGLTIQECRSLNSAADAAAGAITDLCLPVVQGWCSSLTSAHSWAAHAFAVQWHRTQSYHDQLCQDMNTPV